MSGWMEMDENTEPEDHGPCYSRDDDDNVDPQVSLSYLDEKIERVLGHFQKDFEGGASADNLGATFGGYGSFLPADEHFPSVQSHPNTTQRKFNTTRSPNVSMIEGANHNSKAPSCAPPNLSHNTGPLSGDVSVKLGSCLLSSQAADKSSLKEETAIRPGKANDRNPLKFKIRVVSDKTAPRKAAIYRSLGLGDSPLSSLGNSLGGSEGTPLVSQDSIIKSPTQIIQSMTSFQVPGGVLVSPLHERLLQFLSSSTDVKFMTFFQKNQAESPVIVETAMQCEQKLLKAKKKKLHGSNERPVKLKKGSSRNLNNGRTIHIDRKLVDEDAEGNELLPSDMQSAPVSNSMRGDGESVKASSRTPAASKEFNKGSEQGRLFSTVSVAASSGSLSGQNCGKNGKHNARVSSDDKVLEHERTGDMDNFIGGQVTIEIKAGQNSRVLKNYADESKCKEDLDPQKREVSQKAICYEDDENKHPHEEEKSAFEGNNKSRSSKKIKDNAGVSTEGVVRTDSASVREDKKSAHSGVTQCNSKVGIVKLRKNVNKVRDTQEGFSLRQKLEKIPCNRGIADQASSDLLKGTGIVDFEMQQHAPKDRPIESLTAKRLENQKGRAENAGSVCLRNSGSGVNSELPAAVAPVLIEENWVECVRCEKWRLLPFGVKPEQLPENWFCSMQDWLPGMNHCDVSEEESGNAFYALYSLPVSETASVHHANGTFSEVTPAGASSYKLPVLNSSKNQLQQPTKKRSLNDRDCQKNKMRSSDPEPLRKSQNLVPREKGSNQKEKTGGAVKQLKMKNKRKVDKHGFGSGTSKKAKTEDISLSGKLQVSDKGLRKIRAGSPNRNMGGFNEIFSSGDAKNKVLASVKKLEPTHALSGEGLLDARLRDMGNFSNKRNDLKNRQDSLNSQRNAVDKGMHAEEESSESGMMKEKRSRTLKTEGKDFSAASSDENPKKRRWIMAGLLSGSGDSPFTSLEEVKSIDKDQRVSKNAAKGASITSKCIEPLKRDLGYEQPSIGPTSSSSKVSSSCKIKPDLEVKGSPVESVSSSPLRMSSVRRPGKAKKRNGLQSVSHRVSILECAGADNTRNPSARVNIGQHTNDPNGEMDSCYGEARVNEVHIDKAFLLQNKCSSRLSSDNVRDSEFGVDKVKANNPASEHSKMIKRYQQEAAIGPETITVSAKNNYNGRAVGKWSTENGFSEQEVKETNGSDLRSCILSSPNEKVDPWKNLNLDLHVEDNGHALPSELRTKKSKLLLDSEKIDKQGTVSFCHQSAVATEETCGYHGPPGDPLAVCDVPMALEQLESAGNRKVPSRSHLIADGQGTRDVNFSNPGGINSSSHAALNEAKDLTIYAESLKKSGFGFESNEAYFKAALKYLQGASLLEICSSESTKHGEMTQMQAYNTAAKLWNACANEYEKCQDMAAAALAYKCMEVAHMRVVYCKFSVINRDRQELQAILQTVPQGESPSSSASDVDNLNNQAAADKPTLPKGGGSQVFGSPAVIARNCLQAARLLDFTQDSILAMKASSKCTDAFAAANLTLKETQNGDCVSLVKRVIDFCFHDVEELIRLVQHAMEAISRSGFGGPRD